MKNWKLLAVLIVIFLMGIMFYFGVFFEQERRNLSTDITRISSDLKNIKTVFINGVKVQTELALTDQEKRLGLMGRKYMPENKGMLFIWDEDVYQGFWMKNMLMSLDMIFISGENKITDIFANVPPCKEKKCEVYSPSKKGRYVLEVNAGWAERHGVEEGDGVRIGGRL